MATPRPLLSIHNLRKTYGRQVVLEDLSCTVSEGQKIALIGRNGAGKSTLLNILMGLEERDSGEIETLPWTSLGLVAQHEILPSGITSEEYCEKKSSKPSWEIRKLAARFGLTLTHLSKKPSELSGGYQMRLKIVAMLLQDPTLLLLDEPVNYLDLQTLLLLEQFLADYSGSFIVTAHDREFLQNICNTTFEIERGELTTFPGGVEEYLEYKDEQREFLRRTNKRLAKEIAHQQAFVDRFRFKASQASRAQSKIKHIAKLRSKITSVKGDLSTTRITIPTPHFIAGTALRCDKLTIGYGDKVIGENITFEVTRGEKVVIAGENGQGKSTLLKTVAGRIPVLGGQAKWWHKADIGYYDQKTDATLLPDETVLQYLTRMAPTQAPGERILMMAGNFLFRNDDLEKRTSVLSGGERARLCLAGILLHEHSVLLLDEPTNHLDVETAEALAEALKEYGGTVLFISHARTFVNALAERIYEVRNGTLKHYTGTYEEYVADVAERNHAEQRVDIASQNTVSEADALAKQEARLIAKERRKMLDRLQFQIATLEKEKSELLAFFFENPTDYAPEKSRRLNEVTEEIGRLEEQWLRLIS